MAGRCTVFVDDAYWHVGCVDAEGVRVEKVAQPIDASLEAKAGGAAELLQSMGGGSSVVVALPTSWCLSATISTDDLGRSNRRQSMAYLLEEQLPVSAEESVADYCEKQGRALGVCVELGRLRTVIAALESAGLVVRHLCPAAMLAAEQLVAERSGAGGVLVASPVMKGGADLIELDQQTPRLWWWLTDQEALADRLGVWRGETGGGSGAGRLLSVGVTDQQAGGEHEKAEDTDREKSAALRGAAVLSGEVSAWIDLRRDALAAPDAHQVYQKQTGLLLAAVALLLLCVIGVTFWRGSRYEAQADTLRAQQTEVFKEVFPGQRPRGSIKRRLTTEQRTLAGLSGNAPVGNRDGGQALYPTSALTHLHQVLTALPRDARYQVSGMTIEPGLISVDGQAASPVIPEQLASGLRATGLYKVDPPNIRRLKEFGFSFGFIARPAEEDTEVAGRE